MGTSDFARKAQALLGYRRTRHGSHHKVCSQGHWGLVGNLRPYSFHLPARRRFAPLGSSADPWYTSHFHTQNRWYCEGSNNSASSEGLPPLVVLTSVAETVERAFVLRLRCPDGMRPIPNCTRPKNVATGLWGYPNGLACTHRLPNQTCRPKGDSNTFRSNQPLPWCR